MLLLSSPSTPSRSTRHYASVYDHQPLRSSPLASSSPPSDTKSSPVAEAQTRRRAQYKAQAPTSPTIVPTRRTQSRRASSGLPETGVVAIPTEEAPRKSFLRERFRARCIERAQKDRERKIKGRRYLSDSSDGPDDAMDIEDEEDEDAIMNDELFSRIMESANRKEKYTYRLSYSYDVGSSFDPNMEGIDEWEAQLEEVQPEIPVPNNLEEDELAAYAEEYELHLEDLNAEQLFSNSDLSELEDEDVEMNVVRTPSRDKGKRRASDGDVEMAN